MDIEKVKRYSLMEVVLLAVFVFGLLIAHTIVKVRGKITLSEPIELPNSGLKVSVPTNPGWSRVPMWEYESDNSLVLNTRHNNQSEQSQENKIDLEVRWRYVISTPAGTAEELLGLRAQKIGAVIEHINVTSGDFPMSYTRMDSPVGAGKYYLLGIIRLDFGRSIELQVHPHSIDPFFAESLFRMLANSVNYVMPQELTDGKNLLDQLWTQIASGSDESLADVQAEQAYLIKDTKKTTRGFYYQRQSVISQLKNRQIVARQLELNQLMIHSTLLLNGSEHSFNWKTSVQQLGFNQTREYTLSQHQDGTIHLQRSYDNDLEFQSDSLLLPQLMLDDFIMQFLNGDRKALTIDIISAYGRVIPTHISVINPSEASAKSQETETVVRINYIYQPNSFEEYYYNADNALIGRFERQSGQGIRLWDPTTPENLELIFGDYFQQAEQNKVAFHTLRYE